MALSGAWRRGVLAQPSLISLIWLGFRCETPCPASRYHHRSEVPEEKVRGWSSRLGPIPPASCVPFFRNARSGEGLASLVFKPDEQWNR